LPNGLMLSLATKRLADISNGAHEEWGIYGSYGDRRIRNSGNRNLEGNIEFLTRHHDEAKESCAGSRRKGVRIIFPSPAPKRAIAILWDYEGNVVARVAIKLPQNQAGGGVGSEQSAWMVSIHLSVYRNGSDNN